MASNERGEVRERVMKRVIQFQNFFIGPIIVSLRFQPYDWLVTINEKLICD